jgi:hypothetical protein
MLQPPHRGLLVARRALILTLVLATLGTATSAAQARSPALVAIQPVGGAPTLVGASLRAQIARLVRARGYRVVTTIPIVESTGQYLALARDHKVTGFLVSDLNWSKSRHTLTMVVLDGEQGSALGRWSVTAPVRNPGKFLANGFWKHLGPALEKARAPELPVIPPPPGLRLDAN